MPCHHVRFPGGSAIVCMGRPRLRSCPNCGQKTRDPRECDWKIGDGKTCDAKLCERCSFSPSPGKDLCPEHHTAFDSWNATTRFKMRDADIIDANGVR